MDYEKAYKEALAKAREIHRNEDEKRFDMEWLFPELKESEDERIRKALIELVKQSSEILDKQNQNNMITWLEKQGKHDETSIAIKNPEAYRIGFADGEAHAKEEMNTWSDEDEEILKNLIDYFSLDDGLRLPTEETIDWLKSLKERLS